MAFHWLIGCLTSTRRKQKSPQIRGLFVNSGEKLVMMNGPGKRKNLGEAKNVRYQQDQE